MVIRNLRIERGWSQEQLAEISGVSTRTIQRIERGGKASLESLKCLAAVFETPISDLQKDINMTNPDNGLTEEDRAALKYAHYLKSYDRDYDVDGGLATQNMSDAERGVVKHVRKLKMFFTLAIFVDLVLVVLLAINLLTWSGYLWMICPTLGLGIIMAVIAIWLFGFNGPVGESWERRQIEKRLRNL